MTKQPNRWSVPGFFLGIGVVSVLAASIHHHIVRGIVMLAIMAACASALVLLARRSETYRGLVENPDERFARIDERALAGTGFVLTIANLAGFVGNVAAGRSGAPYDWLLVLSAVAFVALVVLFNRVT